MPDTILGKPVYAPQWSPGEFAWETAYDVTLKCFPDDPQWSQGEFAWETS